VHVYVNDKLVALHGIDEEDIAALRFTDVRVPCLY